MNRTWFFFGKAWPTFMTIGNRNAPTQKVPFTSKKGENAEVQITVGE